jgi:cell division protease FtsH
VSTGASDDLQKATDLAERAVTLYGMSPRLGPMAIEKQQNHFIEGWQSPRRTVGEEVSQEIDREVKRFLDEAHRMALETLELNLSVLKDAAQHLLKDEILEGQALQQYLNQLEKPAGLESWLVSSSVKAG